MQSNPKLTKFAIAIVLSFGFLIVLLAPYTTGVPIHEWISLLILIPLLLHLMLAWRWIANVTVKFFKPQPMRTRINYVLDWLLFVLVTTATVSGILISEAALPSLGIQTNIDHFWIPVHAIASRLLVMAIGIHIAMHLGWIVSVFKGRLAIIEGKREKNSGSDTRASVVSEVKSYAAPLVCITLAAGVIAVVLLLFTQAPFADAWRIAGVEASEAARARPKGLNTTMTDLSWLTILMGLPTSLTLFVLYFGKRKSKTAAE